MKTQTALVILSLICMFLAALSVFIAVKYKNTTDGMVELVTRCNEHSDAIDGILFDCDNYRRWITDCEKRLKRLEND